MTRGSAPACLLLIAFVGTPCAGASGFADGPKLTVSGGYQQGASVALSSDGTTALVGAPASGSGVGAVWVFTRAGGHWTKQDELVGTGVSGSFAYQGTAVALSADGNTALVGGPGDGSDLGAAWVFTRTNGTWAAGGTKLTATFIGGAARFGASVALSSDGTVALVGGPGDIQHLATIGAAWVFTLSGGTWTQTTKLFGNVRGTPAPGAQGSSVALSADGTTALIGAPQDTSSTGAVWVWVQSGGSWLIEQELFGTGAGNEGGAARFGFSVALSSDGSTALVGGPYDSSAGASWVFTRSGGVWSLQGSKLIGSQNVGLANQGWAVALTSDGSTALVGGPADGIGLGGGQLYGAAWVFSRDQNGAWSLQGDKLTAWGGAGYPQLGSSAAISGGGNILLLGGPYDQSMVGAAWAFARACIGDAGDVDGSNTVDVADVFYMINFLFAGGPAPQCR